MARDRLVAHTYGAVEVRNGSRASFAEERLHELLRGAALAEIVTLSRPATGRERRR